MIYLIETYAYRTRKDIESDKNEIKCNYIIKRYKMIYSDGVSKENIKINNPNWPLIPDHP